MRTFTAILLCCFAINAAAHDDPDPIGHWIFSPKFVQDGKLAAQVGPSGSLPKGAIVSKTEADAPIGFLGKRTPIVLTSDPAEAKKVLPEELLTVSAWFSVDSPQEYGAVVGYLQDNGNHEKGWALGYDTEKFTFTVSSKGADDGNGAMTFLKGETSYELGRFYHVAGVYDGEAMRLYVNGKLEATSTVQSGDILYPEKAPLTLAGYRDDNENYPHHGKVRSVAIYDLAAKSEWIEKEFARHEALTKEAPSIAEPEEMEFVVTPYLQFVTKTSITVMWETTRKGGGVVEFGETAEFGQTRKTSGAKNIQTVMLDGLKPNMEYFYRLSATDDKGQKLGSEVSSFQTAVGDSDPFAFVIVSDTQSNPKVAKTIAGHAWGQRPHFVLHPGDLVGTGANKLHWTEEFFPSMNPLIARAAFFPVLGNHEGNAKHYYDYVSLPDPEYYYEFTYGNAHFFMLDTNKTVAPGTEQYQWLDAALSKSKATWKICCHHHPPYSSDENDYGDTWKGKSNRGDLKARELVKLYDKHEVDIVWNGHIHSYERTWPLKGDTAVAQKEGTTYLVTGGGGGSLETPGPTRPYFQNNVRRGHHYCFVAVNGGKLEFRAFDLENRPFRFDGDREVSVTNRPKSVTPRTPRPGQTPASFRHRRLQ